MNSHFGCRFLDEKGMFKNQLEMKNPFRYFADHQVKWSRMLGLAYASKLYRQEKHCKNSHHFSNKGNEIVFGSIGDASTSEGVFSKL